MACSFHCAVSLETLFLKESRVNQDISAHVLTNLWGFGFVFYNPEVSDRLHRDKKQGQIFGSSLKCLCFMINGHKINGPILNIRILTWVFLWLDSGQPNLERNRFCSYINLPDGLHLLFSWKKWQDVCVNFYHCLADWVLQKTGMCSVPSTYFLPVNAVFFFRKHI